MSYRKLKILWVSIYAKLMIILQISHIVIFVLKNKIYKMKHTKILRGFFLDCLFLNQILTMFTKFYEEWKKNMKSTKKNPQQ